MAAVLFSVGLVMFPYGILYSVGVPLWDFGKSEILTGNGMWLGCSIIFSIMTIISIILEVAKRMTSKQ